MTIGNDGLFSGLHLGYDIRDWLFDYFDSFNDSSCASGRCAGALLPDYQPQLHDKVTRGACAAACSVLRLGVAGMPCRSGSWQGTGLFGDGAGRGGTESKGNNPRG